MYREVKTEHHHESQICDLNKAMATQGGLHTGFWTLTAWVQILALPFINYLTLGMSLNLPEFHLKDGDNNSM